MKNQIKIPGFFIFDKPGLLLFLVNHSKSKMIGGSYQSHRIHITEY